MSEPGTADTADTPPPRLATGTIIVATDGTHAADGAVRLGVALARRDGRPVTLMSVVEPLPLFDDGVTTADVARLTSVTHESREAALRVQQERTSPASDMVPVAITIGDRVELIADASRTHHASLIVLGLGAHGVTARLLNRETALRVMRSAPVPVLAVPGDTRTVPHRALAALDFTASSELAARAAVDLLGGEGRLYLAHVLPRRPVHHDPVQWDDASTSGVLTRLEGLRDRLRIPAGIEVEYLLLHGDPAQELLRFAEQYPMDLVATGTHGRNALGRLLLGSVSTAVVRGAHCAVLVAPPVGTPNAPSMSTG